MSPGPLGFMLAPLSDVWGCGPVGRVPACYPGDLWFDAQHHIN